jgi:hypothetical protein
VTRRLHPAAAVLIALCMSAPAAAQTGRAAGTVRDTGGHAIRGAIIRAVNQNAHPSQITASTDSKGRWAMIGLQSGQWTFMVEAPGFVAAKADTPIRVAGSPPMTFTLARDPGPLPGALEKNIQQLIADGNTLRDQGRLDQAIAVYDEIRSKNPKLTAVNLVLAETYRKKAAQERDTAARRTLLSHAADSYNEVLKSDASNDRAKAGLESTRSEAAGIN